MKMTLLELKKKIDEREDRFEKLSMVASERLVKSHFDTIAYPMEDAADMVYHSRARGLHWIKRELGLSSHDEKRLAEELPRGDEMKVRKDLKDFLEYEEALMVDAFNDRKRITELMGIAIEIEEILWVADLMGWHLVKNQRNPNERKPLRK